jgi:PAS domain S-box-containing protein
LGWPDATSLLGRPMRETEKPGNMSIARALRVLIVEDQPVDAELAIAILKRAGYTLSFEIVDTPEKLADSLKHGQYDLALSDHDLRTWTGMDVLEYLRKSGQEIPFIVVTGTLGDEAAVDYIKQGAADYVLKHHLERLAVVVGRALREKAQREESARLQEAIFAGKKEWELTFDHVPDVVFLLDEGGRVRRANRGAAELLGMDFKQMIGRPCDEIIHGLREPRMDHASLKEVLDIGGSARRDIEDPRLGKIFELNSSPLRGTSGQLCGAVVVMRDVTERRHTEAKILAANDEWKLTFDTVPDPIILMDKDCRIIRANRAASSLPGLEPAQVIGMHCYEVLHQTTEPRPDCPHQELIKTGSEAHGDLYEPWLDKFFASTATPILDAHGVLGGCVHVLRDVTDRRRAEETLIKLRKAIDASGEVVFMTDPEGVFTFVNPEFTRLYGYSEEEVVGKTTPRVLKNGNRSREEYEEFWKTILNKQVANMEWINRTKDKRPVNVEGCTNPILDEHGDIMGFLEIQRDISQRKRLEEDLRQAQKMEAIGQLAGGVAHDFNNLLTIISGYGELLSSRLGSEHPQIGQVKEIQNAADRASGLTRQLLAFGRRQVLAPQVLDLNHVLSNVDKMLRRLIGEDIEILTISPRALGQVKADAGQMEQIIMNLAINARDAMPKGGKLSIETANVILDEAYTRQHISVTPGPYVMLAVSDNGCGMGAETRARIFEPFYTTKELGKGTGLGLATVYGIVKQSGGHIWVYSEPGKGSTFKIYLPRTEEAAVRPSNVQTICGDRHGTETVLVVEDDQAIRQLVRGILESKGYKILEAGSGAEALSLCHNHSGAIHVILTDVVMPQMSGPEMALQWLARRPQTKIIYMSGYTNNAICHHGLLDRDLAFIEKPFTPQALENKVREVLDAETGATAA